MRKRVFLCILIGWWGMMIHAQLLPPIYNYTPSEYKGESQNWKICQTDNKNIYFVGTLGADPDSGHWSDVFENAKKLCSENNNFKDGLLIWGRISQEMQDMMKNFPASHPHAVTPERLARWEAASTHPDENDFKKAEEFFSNLLNN